METKITIHIDNSQLKQYEADFRKLVATLKKAVAGSPYTFEIIGVTGGAPKPPKAASSIANQAYRELIDQLLTDANFRTNPKAYSAKIMGGHPIPSRINAAMPAAQKMKDLAIQDYVGAREAIPGATTRSQSQIAYQVAQAIFGDNILKYRR